METQNSSPVKKQKPERIRIGTRLQLYNPSHKIDLLKLFTGVKRFSLGEKTDLPESTGKDSLDDNKIFLDFEESDEEDSTSGTVPQQNENAATKGPEEIVGGASKLSCGTCGSTFTELTDLRSHSRLDWHRYNVKRKVHGQKPVSENEFDDMMDELSSIEGSDSENQEPVDNTSRLLEKVTLRQVVEESTKVSAEGNSTEKKLANSPKVYFENDVGRIFGMFKPVAELGVNKQTTSLLNASGDVNNVEFTSDFLKIVNNPLKIAVIMASGGHFAAAVFQGGDVVNHKTFHSYTVRAKQGGSQGSNDSKSGTSHAKSAGASLRRYNEQSFMQHVQDLLESWKAKLAACQVIFIRAVSSNANVLFSGKNPPLQRSDPKLRTVPFPTKRPTYTEVKRVHAMLTVFHVYDDRSQFLSEHMPNTKKSRELLKTKSKKMFDRARSRSPKRHEEPKPPSPSPQESSETEDDVVEINEEVDMTTLQEYDDSLSPAEREAGRKRKRAKSKKPKEEFPRPPGIYGSLLEAFSSDDVSSIEIQLTALKNEFETRVKSPDTTFSQEINQHIDFDESTLLHLAARKNYLDAVWCLLEFDGDPSLKDKSGKYPYNYAATKECRAVFRRFMGQFPEKYDYKQAQVPAPITDEIEAEKAEKKRQLNKVKREKEKLKKMEKKEKEKEVNEKDRFLKLSDREKRALAAEQRILAQCKRNGEKQPVLIRCFECACDMTGKVPFEYNHNIFCTSKCLAVHRKKFPVPLSV